MEHDQQAASNSDVCPVCGGSGWETYNPGEIPGYGIPQDFGRPCKRCRTQMRLLDMTGVPPQFRDADLGKFGFDSYFRDMGELRLIAEDFLMNYRKRWEKAGKAIIFTSNMCPEDLNLDDRTIDRITKKNCCIANAGGVDSQ